MVIVFFEARPFKFEESRISGVRFTQMEILLSLSSMSLFQSKTLLDGKSLVEDLTQIKTSNIKARNCRGFIIGFVVCRILINALQQYVQPTPTHQNGPKKSTTAEVPNHIQVPAIETSPRASSIKVFTP